MASRWEHSVGLLARRFSHVACWPGLETLVGSHATVKLLSKPAMLLHCLQCEAVLGGDGATVDQMPQGPNGIFDALSRVADGSGTLRAATQNGTLDERTVSVVEACCCRGLREGGSGGSRGSGGRGGSVAAWLLPRSMAPRHGIFVCLESARALQVERHQGPAANFCAANTQHDFYAHSTTTMTADPGKRRLPGLLCLICHRLLH